MVVCVGIEQIDDLKPGLATEVIDGAEVHQSVKAELVLCKRTNIGDARTLNGKRGFCAKFFFPEDGKFFFQSGNGFGKSHGDQARFGVVRRFWPKSDLLVSTLRCNVSSPSRRASGRGGQPEM